jgi:hypothetical protein
MHYIVRDRQARPKPAKIIRDTAGKGVPLTPNPQSAVQQTANQFQGAAQQTANQFQGAARQKNQRATKNAGKFLASLPVILFVAFLILSNVIPTISNEFGGDDYSDTSTVEYQIDENEFYYGDLVEINFDPTGYEWIKDDNNLFTEANSGHKVLVFAEGNLYLEDAAAPRNDIEIDSDFSALMVSDSAYVQKVAATLSSTMDSEINSSDFTESFDGSVEIVPGSAKIIEGGYGLPFLLSADYVGDALNEEGDEPLIHGKVMVVAAPRDPANSDGVWDYAVLAVTFSDPVAEEDDFFIFEIKTTLIYETNYPYNELNGEDYGDSDDEDE